MWCWGAFAGTPQPPPNWGGGGGGEVAMAADMGLPPPPPPKLSDALRRENMVSVSGKLGGVAGVLAGVHIWDGERNKRVRRLKYLDWNDLISISFNPTFVFFLFLIMFYLRLFFYY